MAYNELNEQELGRRESLQKLRELGINPYPAPMYPVNTTTVAIAEGYKPEEGNFQDVCIAGRIMSRKQAFDRLSMEEYAAEMEGIWSSCVVKDTLDESPMAYKPLDEIVSEIGPTADIIERIRPVYNFKAAE